MPSRADIKRYKANLQEEIDVAALYDSLAEAEQDDGVADIYRRIAQSEGRHVDFWQRRLREAGSDIPRMRPRLRVRALGLLARRFGPNMVLPSVHAREVAAVDYYTGQPEAERAGLHVQERSHARALHQLSYTEGPREASHHIMQVERRHRVGGGNALRAAVLGANDGIVSNLSLVMGVAGADPGRQFVLLAGLTGMLAGAFSMAMGEWISVQSSRELYERQLAIEAEELAGVPGEEAEELALIYEAKGIERGQARDMARQIISNPETALDTLAREELGVDPRDLGSPGAAALASLALFAAAAIVPVLPFFFFGGTTGIALSAIISAIALFGVGAAITLFTGRGMLFSGTRQVAIGLAASAVTFAIGRLIGVSTGLT